MSNIMTAMQREATEAGERIAIQISENDRLTEDIAHQINQISPSFVLMIGRGSSDHAALFAKYLIEVELGIPVVNAAPSVATLFNTELQFKNALVIAISQSGQSPDLIEYVEMANRNGAFSIALVNDTSSPLAKSSKAVLPLAVGEERAVAATKSFLGSLSALLQLVSKLSEKSSLQSAIQQIPEALLSTVSAPAQLSYQDLAEVQHCVVTGRGFGFAIGTEIALKMKEVCAIQAECFSSAEFLHGPVRIVSDNFHVLDVLIDDETYLMHQSKRDYLEGKGAVIKQLCCPLSDIYPRVAPLVIMQRFYLDLEVISRQMGYNPDKPEGLSKVTETL